MKVGYRNLYFMSRKIYDMNLRRCGLLPDKSKTDWWVETLFHWLFSIGERYESLAYFTATEEQLREELAAQIQRASGSGLAAKGQVELFFEALPDIRLLLEADLETVLESDPAARSRNEVLLAYPGFFAVAIHRIAHVLFVLEIPVLPRLMSEYVHSKTGIDIHPGATVGKRFFIDHGTGIVIGETARIGDHVKMYQGVTLGALTVSKDLAEIQRHPSIGNDVVIYANATILGGDTVIGDHSVIGGNVWITRSVPAHSLVYHKSEVIVKNKTPFPEPLNYSI